MNSLENLSKFTHNIFNATGIGFVYLPKETIKNKEVIIYSYAANRQNITPDSNKLVIIGNHSVRLCNGESEISFKEVGTNYFISFYGIGSNYIDNTVQVFLN